MIDVDDVSTWPPALVATVDEAIQRLSDAGHDGSALWLGDQVEHLIRGALADVTVRLYHATRMLPHEVASVRAEGLQLLDEELISAKLRAAVLAGALSEPEAVALGQAHTKLDGSAGRRAGQVCASASTWNFRHDVHAVWRLLTTWGGEAIYREHEGTDFAERLRCIGSPVIVVFGAPAARFGDDWYPSVANLLVSARRRGADEVNADVFIRSPVPPGDVEAIWTSTTAEYRRFARLPR